MHNVYLFCENYNADSTLINLEVGGCPERLQRLADFMYIVSVVLATFCVTTLHS